MKHLFILFVSISLLISGCCSGKGCSNEPVVSPTNTSTEVQESGVPILPVLIPWWVK